MKTRFSGPAFTAALVGTSLLSVLVSPSGAAGGAQLFTGGGYGPTPALAVQAAIEDAENSASAAGLYTCQLVGQPMVFPRGNSPRGPSFNAEATVRCTP
jgi:hypothetical protein